MRDCTSKSLGGGLYRLRASDPITRQVSRVSRVILGFLHIVRVCRKCFDFHCAEDVLGSHGIELANSIISIFLVSTSIYWNVRQPDEAALQYSRRKTWG